MDSHRSTPELPQKCDIVIIGADYTGATIAYHLLDENESAGPSMVILEAREACSGATGRNGKTPFVILYAEYYTESSSLSKYPIFFNPSLPLLQLLGRGHFPCDISTNIS